MTDKDLQRVYAGIILQDNNAYYETKVQDQHITDPLTKEILSVAKEIMNEGKEANIITVCERSSALKQRAAEVTETTAGLHNQNYIEDMIIHRYQTKKIKELAEKLKRVADKPEEALALIDESVTDIANINATDKIYESNTLLKSIFDIIEKRYHQNGELAGIPSGIRTLDIYTAGFQDGLLYVIGARPSQGKSAMLMNIASFMAGMNYSVGIISAESSKTELLMRDLANVASIDSYRIRTGFLKESDFSSLSKAASKMYERKMAIYDVPNIGITKLQSVAKLMVRKYGVQILLVDYLQIIKSTRSSDLKRDQVAEVSLALKNLSRSLNIPIIVAAQLTRDSENRRPGLRDFADSSQIEKDADVALLLHHEYNDMGETDMVYLNIEKNRDGAKTSIPMEFDGRYVRFKEVPKQAIAIKEQT